MWAGCDMSVQVIVQSITGKIAIVEAYNGDKKIFKSPMDCKSTTKSAIEKQLKKELRAFDSHAWGGFHITFSQSIRW